MKRILILGFGLILSANAHAKVFTNFDLEQLSHPPKKYKLMDSSDGGSIGGPATSLTPIRTAKAKVHVTKDTYISNGTSISATSEDVCQKEVDVDVYDARGLPGYSMSTQGIDCTSTIRGQSTSVSLFLSILLSDSGLFSDEPAAETKDFNASMMTGDEVDPFARVRSRDLNTHNIVVEMNGDAQARCTSTNCTITYPEVFRATIEFKD